MQNLIEDELSVCKKVKEYLWNVQEVNECSVGHPDLPFGGLSGILHMVDEKHYSIIPAVLNDTALISNSQYNDDCMMTQNDLDSCNIKIMKCSLEIANKDGSDVPQQSYILNVSRFRTIEIDVEKPNMFGKKKMDFLQNIARKEAKNSSPDISGKTTTEKEKLRSPFDKSVSTASDERTSPGSVIETHLFYENNRKSHDKSGEILDGDDSHFSLNTSAKQNDSFRRKSRRSGSHSKYFDNSKASGKKQTRLNDWLSEAEADKGQNSGSFVNKQTENTTKNTPVARLVRGAKVGNSLKESSTWGEASTSVDLSRSVSKDMGASNSLDCQPSTSKDDEHVRSNRKTSKRCSRPSASGSGEIVSNLSFQNARRENRDEFDRSVQVHRSGTSTSLSRSLYPVKPRRLVINDGSICFSSSGSDKAFSKRKQTVEVDKSVQPSMSTDYVVHSRRRRPLRDVESVQPSTSTDYVVHSRSRRRVRDVDSVQPSTSAGYVAATKQRRKVKDKEWIEDINRSFPGVSEHDIELLLDAENKKATQYARKQLADSSIFLRNATNQNPRNNQAAPVENRTKPEAVLCGKKGTEHAVVEDSETAAEDSVSPPPGFGVSETQSRAKRQETQSRAKCQKTQSRAKSPSILTPGTRQMSDLIRGGVTTSDTDPTSEAHSADNQLSPSKNTDAYHKMDIKASSLFKDPESCRERVRFRRVCGLIDSILPCSPMEDIMIGSLPKSALPITDRCSRDGEDDVDANLMAHSNMSDTFLDNLSPAALEKVCHVPTQLLRGQKGDSLTKAKETYRTPKATTSTCEVDASSPAERNRLDLISTPSVSRKDTYESQRIKKLSSTGSKATSRIENGAEVAVINDIGEQVKRSECSHSVTVGNAPTESSMVICNRNERLRRSNDKNSVPEKGGNSNSNHPSNDSSTAIKSGGKKRRRLFNPDEGFFGGKKSCKEVRIQENQVVKECSVKVVDFYKQYERLQSTSAGGGENLNVVGQSKDTCVGRIHGDGAMASIGDTKLGDVSPVQLTANPDRDLVRLKRVVGKVTRLHARKRSEEVNVVLTDMAQGEALAESQVRQSIERMVTDVGIVQSNKDNDTALDSHGVVSDSAAVDAEGDDVNNDDTGEIVPSTSDEEEDESEPPLSWNPNVMKHSSVETSNSRAGELVNDSVEKVLSILSKHSGVTSEKTDLVVSTQTEHSGDKYSPILHKVSSTGQCSGSKDSEGSHCLSKPGSDELFSSADHEENVQTLAESAINSSYDMINSVVEAIEEYTENIEDKSLNAEPTTNDICPVLEDSNEFVDMDSVEILMEVCAPNASQLVKSEEDCQSCSIVEKSKSLSVEIIEKSVSVCSGSVGCNSSEKDGPGIDGNKDKDVISSSGVSLSGSTLSTQPPSDNNILSEESGAKEPVNLKVTEDINSQAVGDQSESYIGKFMSFIKRRSNVFGPVATSTQKNDGVSHVSDANASSVELPSAIDPDSQHVKHGVVVDSCSRTSSTSHASGRTTSSSLVSNRAVSSSTDANGQKADLNNAMKVVSSGTSNNSEKSNSSVICEKGNLMDVSKESFVAKESSIIDSSEKSNPSVIHEKGNLINVSKDSFVSKDSCISGSKGTECVNLLQPSRSSRANSPDSFDADTEYKDCVEVGAILYPSASQDADVSSDSDSGYYKKKRLRLVNRHGQPMSQDADVESDNDHDVSVLPQKLRKSRRLRNAHLAGGLEVAVDSPQSTDAKKPTQARAIASRSSSAKAKSILESLPKVNVRTVTIPFTEKPAMQKTRLHLKTAAKSTQGQPVSGSERSRYPLRRRQEIQDETEENEAGHLDSLNSSENILENTNNISNASGESHHQLSEEDIFASKAKVSDKPCFHNSQGFNVDMEETRLTKIGMIRSGELCCKALGDRDDDVENNNDDSYPESQGFEMNNIMASQGFDVNMEELD